MTRDTCHSREGARKRGNPASNNWAPAFAGATPIVIPAKAGIQCSEQWLDAR